MTGSEAELRAQEAARMAKGEERKQSKDDRAVRIRQERMARAGGTVIEDVGRALHTLSNTETPDWMPAIATTDALGLWEAYKNIQSAVSNIGIDQLQQIRESNVTGGALGQIPVQQQRRLEQMMGSLDMTQRKSTVIANLKRIQNLYHDLIYGTPEQNAQLLADKVITAEEAEWRSFRHELPFDRMGRPKAETPPPSDLQEVILPKAVQ